jgi:hypothetical protein
MPNLPADSPGAMVIDVEGGVASVPGSVLAAPFGVASAPGAVAAAPVGVASVPGAVAAAPVDVALVPGAVAAAPGAVAAAAAVPQLSRKMGTRIDEGDQRKIAFNNREFHVLMHELHTDTIGIRKAEPSDNTVLRFAALRRRCTKQEFVRESLMCAEHWPKLFLRVKELEDKQSQASKKEKRAGDQNKKRAAKAKAKAQARAKAKAKAAA